MSRPRIKPMVYEIENKDGFISKISTNTTDEFPKVVFLRTKVTLTPIHNEKTYEEKVLKMKKEFETTSLNVINNLSDFENDYIFTSSVAEKSVKFHKKSHFHYDLFLKPKYNKTLLELKPSLETLKTKLNNRFGEMLVKYNMRTC